MYGHFRPHSNPTAQPQVEHDQQDTVSRQSIRRYRRRDSQDRLVFCNCLYKCRVQSDGKGLEIRRATFLNHQKKTRLLQLTVSRRREQAAAEQTDDDFDDSDSEAAYPDHESSNTDAYESDSGSEGESDPDSDCHWGKLFAQKLHDYTDVTVLDAITCMTRMETKGNGLPIRGMKWFHEWCRITYPQPNHMPTYDKTQSYVSSALGVKRDVFDVCPNGIHSFRDVPDSFRELGKIPGFHFYKLGDIDGEKQLVCPCPTNNKRFNEAGEALQLSWLGVVQLDRKHGWHGLDSRQCHSHSKISQMGCLLEGKSWPRAGRSSFIAILHKR